MSEQRALLLTDVVSSTRLAEQLGDAAMSALWQVHDRLARGLLRTWRGREIDKSDGFLLLFDAVADAVGYALAYHRALATLAVPLQARAGLHVGPVIVRENSAVDVGLGAKPIEVDGLAKPTAARIMAIALGGQTLLSAEAHAALGAGAWTTVAHGHWRLQGIEAPFELFEVGAGDAPFTPPPDSAKAYRVVRREDLWLPARDVRHSLPAERDPFIGRRDALQELARRFAGGARWVSVLAVGGGGKTRLALHFGWSWLGDYPGGVWFCDLSQALGVDGIVHAVGQGLDVPLRSGDPVAQLGHAIAGRGRCLVILDNFEQVARHADATFGRWLDRAAEACFLVTTRELLGLPGEHVLNLAALTAPDAQRLFIQRAQAARPGLRLSADDKKAVAPLVALLDGLPLAIELAAARVRVIPPRELLLRMGERFKLLTSQRGRPDRQATLRRTLDWSWDLLAEAERLALAQLSVFKGGFSFDAAEAVLDLSACRDAPSVLDVVQALVDKSLVRQLSDARFDLLVSVSEYGADRLLGSDGGREVARETRRRHGEYFAQISEVEALAERCINTENLVAACRWAIAEQQLSTATAALDRTWAALLLRGPFSVAQDLADTLCSITPADAASAAKLDQLAGRIGMAAGRTEDAGAKFEQALATARQTGDRRLEGSTLTLLADLHLKQGRMDAAAQCYERALAIATGLGDPTMECEVLNGLGTFHEFRGAFALAEQSYSAALRLAHEAGNRRWAGGILGNLGQHYANRGDGARAREHYEASLQTAHEIGDRAWEGSALCNLGLLCHSEGDSAQATVFLQQALAIAADLGNERLRCVVLCNLGLATEALGQGGAAREHYEQAIGVAESIGDRRSQGQFLGYLALLNAREGRFGDASRGIGAALTLLRRVGDPVSLGIALCTLVECACAAPDGHGLDAAAAIGEADQLREQLGPIPNSEFEAALARAKNAFRR